MSYDRPYSLTEYHDAVKFNGSFGISMVRMEATMHDRARLEQEVLTLTSKVAHLLGVLKEAQAHLRLDHPVTADDLIEDTLRAFKP